MEGVPLAIKLKKRVHKEVAFAQDLVVIEAYDSFPGAVLHGGTAIWRCYRGNRFSEDLDFYLPNAGKTREERFVHSMQRRGFVEQKFKRTRNTIFARFAYSNVLVSFEASLRPVAGSAVALFEMLDGSFITVNTLRPEQLVLEKISAYMSRWRVRDLYDIFFLLHIVKEKRSIGPTLAKLVDNFRRPIDEKELKATILFGSAPKVENMLEAIKEWEK